jgi:hypothetical protein
MSLPMFTTDNLPPGALHKGPVKPIYFSPGNAAQLASIRPQIEKLNADVTALNQTAQKAEAALPESERAVKAMETLVASDASDANVFSLLIAERRFQFYRQFGFNIANRRVALEAAGAGLFSQLYPLWGICFPGQSVPAFLNSGRLEQRVADAIREMGRMDDVLKNQNK